MVCKPIVKTSPVSDTSSTFLDSVEKRLGAISQSGYDLVERQSRQLGRFQGSEDANSGSAASPCPPGKISSLNGLLETIEILLGAAHDNQSRLDGIV